MLKTTADSIYWKQESKNRVVFCEFLTFDFCLSDIGGIYLKHASQWQCYTPEGLCLPRLLLNCLECNVLYTQTYRNLA